MKTDIALMSLQMIWTDAVPSGNKFILNGVYATANPLLANARLLKYKGDDQA